MGFTANVVDGNIILAAWGNEVRDRTLQVFATEAERDAQWAAPPNGAHCVTADTYVIWVREGSAWVPVVPRLMYLHIDRGPAESGDIGGQTPIAQTPSTLFKAGWAYFMRGKIGVVSRAAGNSYPVGQLAPVGGGAEFANTLIQIPQPGLTMSLDVAGWYYPAADITTQLQFRIYNATGTPFHYYLAATWPAEVSVIGYGPKANQ